MTDNLRTRIAAAIDKQYTTGVSHRTYDEWLKHTADAVIRALGLQPEYCVRHESGGGTITKSRNEAHRKFDTFVERPPGVEDPGSGKLTGVQTRYVTEWADDDVVP